VKKKDDTCYAMHIDAGKTAEICTHKMAQAEAVFDRN
jgi:hypothetical protein